MGRCERVLEVEQMEHRGILCVYLGGQISSVQAGVWRCAKNIFCGLHMIPSCVSTSGSGYLIATSTININWIEPKSHIFSSKLATRFAIGVLVYPTPSLIPFLP